MIVPKDESEDIIMNTDWKNYDPAQVSSNFRQRGLQEGVENAQVRSAFTMA